MPLTIAIPATIVTIPMWGICLALLLLGVVCMWLSGRCERAGIKTLTPNSDAGITADAYFRCMGVWRLVAYVVALVFLWLIP